MSEQHTFQAEVQQLLDIVIHSLYTDREIFLRELVSNASDALEKLRYLQLQGETVYDDGLKLEINITTDADARTITLQDFGVGMTREELMDNLGTIARSGSKAFAQALKEARENGSGGEAANLIGQFGVGFYSAFMVAEAVTVYTHSYKAEGENLKWSSRGDGAFSIEATEDTQRRGAKLVLKLKEDAKEFTSDDRIEGLLKHYSSFVPFPIHLNGKRVNTQEALWTRSKSEVTPEQYKEFYQFQAKAFDEPRYTLHFSADAPLAIQALLFTPQENMERFGLGRQEPGVALYCKKVLIDPKPEGLLPDWLRFLKGVVDSADLPLNISRESMQDSALVQKLGKVLTGRYLKSLEEAMHKNPEGYDSFYATFGMFLREGVVTDPANKERLGKLLRFESSATEAGGNKTSLSDYVSRMAKGQKAIYYLYAPTRETIEQGPYLEAFKARNLEVLYLYEPLDELVMSHLHSFDDKTLSGADQADLELGDTPEAASAEGGAPLDEARAQALTAWLKESLGEQVAEVRISKRLVDSPAAALNADAFMSGGMRRMMRQMQREVDAQPRAHLEINPRHALIHKLDTLREQEPELAREVAAQIHDNALVAAGLVEDPRGMVNRIYSLLEQLAGRSPS